MSPEEQATFDAMQTRALDAERDLAIHTAAAGHAWIMPADAADGLRTRASRDEKGALRFLSEKKGPAGEPIYIDAAAAAAELAAGRPHWVKAKLTPGTGATGAAQGSRAPKAPTTYAELLKPENAALMREYVSTKADELARLRDAHFKG